MVEWLSRIVILSVNEGPCWRLEETQLQEADKLFQRFARKFRATSRSLVLNMTIVLMNYLLIIIH